MVNQLIRKHRFTSIHIQIIKIVKKFSWKVSIFGEFWELRRISSKMDFFFVFLAGRSVLQKTPLAWVKRTSSALARLSLTLSLFLCSLWKTKKMFFRFVDLFLMKFNCVSYHNWIISRVRAEKKKEYAEAGPIERAGREARDEDFWYSE